MPIIGTETSPLSAQQLVNEAWDYYRNLGDQWIQLASTTIGELDSVHVEPISFNVVYDVDDFLPTFVRPDRPTAPVVDTITPIAVETPELDAIAIRELGDAPEEPDFDALGPYNPPAPPSDPVPNAPADIVPVLDEIVMPERPDYVLPELPTLFDLNLPEVPTITRCSSRLPTPSMLPRMCCNAMLSQMIRSPVCQRCS